MSIEHVSDTARWVAVYRALESERPDALFDDPFARKLAGDGAEAMVRAIPRAMDAAWAMIVRTAVMDEIILRLVREEGVDVVLNLAAGLDTRPYRLDLPAELMWVEADFAPMLAYKTERLEAEVPRCRLAREPVDLTDGQARRTLLHRAVNTGSRGLVVTEGLMVYLTREKVGAFATDLHGQPALRWWLSDLASPRLLKMMQRTHGQAMDDDVRFTFAPPEGPDFFAPFGWHLAEYHSAVEEARRLNRQMRGAWIVHLISAFSKKQREEARRMSGVVLLERDGA
ncbi:MAG: class I SAM-dependent methyltransferase [Gemmatimonadota bacterium]